MALPASTFATYEAIGNREDLTDIIYRIDPTDTPFMSGIQREKASAVNHEWQTQALAAAGANAQIEGDDPTTNTTTTTVRLGNIARSPTRLRASPARSARSTMPAETTNSPIRRCSRASSSSATWSSFSSAPTRPNRSATDTSARLTASCSRWIKTNTQQGHGWRRADPAAADGTGTRMDGTQTGFHRGRAEDRAAGHLDQRRQARHDHDRRVQQTGVLHVHRPCDTDRADQARKRSSPSVDTYESDFGVFKVVPNRFLRSRDVLALWMEMWALAFLNGRRMVSVPLAKTGDSDRRMLLSEYALVARNEKGSGGVFDNTTS